ncbi:MAG: hypothetical protein NUV56_00055 [Candidatus Uhrbacteria bacterium]|nr:hypothetical protein [Candidatus Uhrbacteria bacterium]
MKSSSWERPLIIFLAIVVVIETALLFGGIASVEVEPVPLGMKGYSSNGISFYYDDSFSKTNAEAPYTFLSDTVVALKSDEALYVVENFSQDQWFVISRETMDEGSCFGGIENEQAAFDDVSTINNVTFRVAAFEGAAAGNRYESTVYRTQKDGMCYEIATTLHYASDWTDIVQADMDASLNAGRAMLANAVGSFQFTE